MVDMYLTIHLVPAARIRLERIAELTKRKVEDIAAEAVEDAAKNFFRPNGVYIDPAKLSPILLKELQEKKL